ncbi:hypothetical protein CLV68_1859 [Actinokineospora cianjurensis]|uniref:PH (Pleckstrin Homology) domain-containing protein n=2 Tax=Actinokineospora cianjurensis TaxID=585224 RepID=A0A421B9U1_9PSEU|nr:hypothetical protein CLV68_1859 [Actinokineospora cianjurensis]
MAGRFLSGSRPINGFGLAVMCVLSALVPSYLVLEWGAGLPAIPIAAVVAAGACEVIWRSGLRPRLLWNEGGLTAVWAVRVRALRWSEIARIDVRGNAFLVATGDGESLRWEFDRVWWLARLSRRYADVGSGVGARLQEALDSGRAGGELHRPPEFRARRPWLVFVLVVAAAAALTPLVTKLMLA